MNFLQKLIVLMFVTAFTFVYARTSLSAPGINLLAQHNDIQTSQQAGDNVSPSAGVSNGSRSEISFPRHPYSPESIAQSGIELAAHLRERSTQSNQANKPSSEISIKAALVSGGAAGIDEVAGVSDCWFASALGAFARTPRGQKLLSEMIVQDSLTSYTVTFYSDIGRSVTVSDEEITKERARDISPWARILETAAIKCWPDLVEEKIPKNISYRGPIGLSVLCGNQVQCINLRKCPLAEIDRVLNNSLSANQPMTAGTYTSETLQKRGISQVVVVPKHIFTVISYDHASGKITLRNPWGHNSTANNRSRLPDLPQAGQESAGVLDMGGGLVQMSLPTFRQYYHYLAWTVL